MSDGVDISTSAIAIIGMSGRFPGAPNLERYWANIASGTESVTRLSRSELLRSGVPGALIDHPRYVAAEPTLDGYDLFDADLFRQSPRTAALIDPQQRIFLECAREALELAGHLGSSERRSIGVFAGSGGVLSSYLISHLHVRSELLGFTGSLRHVGNDKDFLCTRVSYELDLRGPSVTVQTACSTSLVAVHMACQSILAGECDLALAGGVTVRIPHAVGYLFEEDGILSPDGHCRPFDAQARGTLFGSGVGVIVLRPLRDAVANGDLIHAVIRGSAIGNDGGHKTSFWATRADGQAAAMREALAVADVDPATIELVEAHGSGTVMGDQVEVLALERAYASKTQRRRPCALGSVKSNIGHLEAAAGIAGLMKVVLALQHETIPPTINFDTLNPKIATSSSRFEVAAEPQAWDAPVRRAAVNALGIGGTNAHVILEQAPRFEPPRVAPEGPHVLVLSAHTERALEELAEATARQLAAAPEIPFADVCHTSNRGRPAASHRVALTARSNAEAASKLAALRLDRAARGLASGQASRAPRLAFLFTGQGSQYPGMGERLYRTEPRFAAAIDHCAEVLRPLLDEPLQSLLFAGAEHPVALDRTEVTQPVLFAIEWSLAELWMGWGVRPAALLGHSLGEYVAACIAGVMSLEDGLRFVTERGRLMSTLPGDTAMAAVVAELDTLTQILGQRQGSISVAADNGPGNVVVVGTSAEVEALLDELEQRGIASTRLRVSQAFHSHLLDPVLDRLEAVARAIPMRAPNIPIISGVTGEPCDPDTITTPGYWVAQTRRTVQFARGVETLGRLQIDGFVEIGPRPTLLGMVRRISSDAVPLLLPSLDPREDDREVLLGSLGRLFTRGTSVDWAQVHLGEGRRHVLLPPTPLQRRRHWVGSAAISPLARGDDGPTSDHPLLGRQLALPFSRETRFEWRLAGAVLADLADHRLFGEIVIPAAYYVAILIAACRQLWGSERCRMTNLVFPRSVELATGDELSFQLILTDSGDGAFDLRFAFMQEQGWRSCCEGRIEPLAAAAGAPESFAASSGPSSPGSLGYEALDRLGYNLGRSFRWLDETSSGERLGARLRPPSALATFEFHPGLIDSCYQLSILAELGRMAAEHRILVPFEIGELTVYAPPAGADLLQCIVVPHVGDGLHGAATLQLVASVGGSAEVLFELHDLVARFASREQLGPARALARSFFVVDWVPALHPIPDETRRADHWLILADCQGVGAELARALANHGVGSTLVHAGAELRVTDEREFVVDPTCARDLDAVIDATLDRGEAIAGLVHLWGLSLSDGPVGHGHGVWLGCGALLHAVQSLVRRSWSDAPRLVTVTRQVRTSESKSSLSQAPQWGLARVIALEHPELGVRAVDLFTAERDEISALALELLAADAESEVALRAGARSVGRLARVELPGEVFRPRSDGTYLLAGGLGALGLVVARWLAEQGARSLAFISRTGETSSEAQGRALQELHERGVRTHVYAADIADGDALAGVLAALAAHGPICGVFHMAGVLDDATLVNLDGARFERVMAPKLLGAWNLHEQTRHLELDCFVLFSSVASLFGLSGQGNYAAANAGLDAVARHRRSLGLPALSINWGPWLDTGMAARLDEGQRQQLERRGLGSIRSPWAMSVMARCLASGLEQIGVQPLAGATLLAQVPGARRPFFACLAPLEPEAPPPADGSTLLDRLRALVGRILQRDAGEIQIETNLLELGLDSLGVIDLRATIKQELGVTLPLSTFFDHPTIAGLLEHLAATSLGLSAGGFVAETCSTPGTCEPKVAEEHGDPTHGRNLAELAPSDGQQSLWLLHQLEPDQPANNMAFCARVQPPLTVAVLRTAVLQLVERHEALRMVFPALRGLATASLLDVLAPEFEVVDLAGLAPEAAAEAVAAVHQRPFDLEHGPLLRICVFRLDPNTDVLLVTLHHIVGDFASLELVMRELEVFYQLELGVPVQVPEPPPSLAQALRRDAAIVHGPLGAAARAHWSEQLRDLPPPLRWPAPVRARPSAGRTVAFTLEPQLSAELRRFGACRAVTVNAILMTAWAELLRRYTDEVDIVVGMPVSIRRPYSEGCVGYFVNTLPIRMSLADAAGFEDRVARVHETITAGLEHRQLPFPRIVEAARAKRYAGRTPVYQTIVAFQQAKRFPAWAGLYLADTSTEVAPSDWGGHRLLPWGLAQQERQIDLMLEVVDAGDRLRCAIKADLSRVADGFAEELATRMVELLHATLGSHDLVGDFELPQHAPSAPAGETFLGMFQRSVTSQPHRIAVTDGEAVWTYAELDRRSAGLATLLRRAGVRRGDRVAVCLTPSTKAVLAMLAVMRAGASYLAIVPTTPRTWVDRVTAMAQVRHAIAGPEEVALFAAKIAIIVPDDQEEPDADLLSDEPPQSEDLAYTIFTSGSTGVPKGVDVRHTNLVAMLEAMVSTLDVGCEDRFSWFHAASFDFSVWEIWGALAYGSTLVVVPATTRGRPDALLSLLDAERVTILSQTPSALRLLADELERRGRSELPWRHVLVCGEPLPGKLARQMLGRGATVWNLYGVAEATVFSTILRIDEYTASFDVVPLGEPLASADVQLLDTSGRPVPPFVVGELAIGGPAVAVGYVGLDELTAERFRSGPSGVLYMTGDMAYRAEGQLHFEGRRDGMVKVRGYRIELGELESVLRTCDGVLDGAAAVVETPHGRELAVFVVVDPSRPGSESSIRAEFEQSLPAYMSPSRIYIVDRLPITSHHKLDRAALLQSVPEPDHDERSELDQGPQGQDILDVIRRTWCAVLQRDSVDSDAAFFEVGGTSIALMQVYAQLCQHAFAAGLQPSDLFAHPTPRRLARFVTRADGSPRRAPSGSQHPAPRQSSAEIAVVGLNIRVPGAESPEAFWSSLLAGEIGLRRLDPRELAERQVPAALIDDPAYVPIDNTLRCRAEFDPDFFGLSDREAALLDPQHRLLLEVAWELLETLGRNGQDPLRIGLFAGAGFNTYLLNVLDRSSCDLSSLSGTELMLTNDKDFMPSRVSHALGLTGPSIAVQTGCSSSLVAVHMAIRSLQAADCDLALAGGVSVHVTDQPGYLHEPNLVFSPDGFCRAFDQAADGTPFADGVGLVALRRLDDAIADGDVIEAVILGSATNHDGANRVGFTAPGVDGQRALIRAAQAEAGIRAEDIGYVEAHGTATRLGDQVELAALTEVFRADTDRQRFCALGTVKANFGHLAAASGVAGLAKAILAVRDGTIPPHPTFKAPPPDSGLDRSPFFVNDRVIAWPSLGPRRASVSSFGMGGSNAHLILGQPPAPALRPAARSIWHCAPLSARTAAALRRLCLETAVVLEGNAELRAEDVAATLQQGRRVHPHRIVVFGRTVEQLAVALRDAAAEPPLVREGGRLLVMAGTNAALAWLADPDLDANALIREQLSSLERGGVLAPSEQEVLGELGSATSTAASARLVALVVALSLWWRATEQSCELITAGLASLAAEVVTGRTELSHALGELALSREGDDALTGELGERDFVIGLAQAASSVGAPVVIPGLASNTMQPGWFARTLAACWQRGFPVDWSVLNPSPGRRIGLPRHPLLRRRCWWTPDTITKRAPDEPASEVWIQTETWHRWRAPRKNPKLLPLDGPLLIFEDQGERAAVVVDALRRAGTRVVVVKPGECTQRATEDLFFLEARAPEAGRELARLLHADGFVPARILHAWGLDDASVPTAGLSGLHAFLEFTSELEPGRSVPVDVVTSGLFAVTTEDRVDAIKSAVLGAVAVLPQELGWPEPRILDLGSDDSLAVIQLRTMLGDLLVGDPDASTLALRHGYLWRRDFQPASPEEPLGLTAGGLCLVTGGLGQVGLTLGADMATRYGVPLLLLGRSEVPPRDDWDRLLVRDELDASTRSLLTRLRALEQRGVEFMLAKADITDHDQVARALADGQARFGPIRSFLHCAGVPPSDSVHWLARSSRADWERVIRPKLIGAQILHEMIEPASLELGCFVSSLSSLVGGQGLAAYAAAHACLDGMARAYRGQRPYLSVSWDGWQGWTSEPPLPTAAARRRETLAFTPEQVVAAHKRALACLADAHVTVSQVELAVRADPRRAAQDPDRARQPEVVVTRSAGPRAIQDRLSSIWARVLGKPAALDDNFFDAGGDSLRAVELIQRVNQALGTTLAPPDLFAAPTVRTLAELILGARESDDDPSHRRRMRREQHSPRGSRRRRS